MNKKYIKIIVSILIIILLIGLGIFGYKKIKNRNNDSKVIENNNNLKAVDNVIELTTGPGVKSSTVKVNGESKYVYFFYKIYVKQVYEIQDGKKIPKKSSLSCSNSNGQVYDLIFEPYVLISQYSISDYANLYTSNSKTRLKSSWIIKNYESCSSSLENYMDEFISNSKVTKISDKYFVISFSTSCTASNFRFTVDKKSFKYSKVYNIETGEMVFEVPTNNLELFDKSSYEVVIPEEKGKSFKIKVFTNNNSYLRIGKNSSATEVNDKIAVCGEYNGGIYNGDLYYLDTNYNNKELNGKQLLDIHKVSFGTNYTNQYSDINLTQEDIELDNKGDTTTVRNIYKVYATVTLNGES